MKNEEWELVSVFLNYFLKRTILTPILHSSFYILHFLEELHFLSLYLREQEISEA